MRNIGKFSLRKGAGLRVSDPTYSKDTWCTFVIRNARHGIWCAFIDEADIEDWGRRITVLSVQHQAHMGALLEWRLIKEAEIGVDSGRCGFYDDREYPQDGALDWPDSKFEMLTWGVSTTSGLGDGVYPLFVQEHEGKVVAAKLQFVPHPVLM